VDQLEYYRFMGYSSEVLRERYQPYAAMFPSGGRVLDVGCGRGEFLEVLRDHGIRGLGVDLDASMVGYCRERGLEAEAADAVAYAEAHPGEFDGAFASHLVEHLAPEPLERFIGAMAGTLRPGGRLVLVTPDPRNLGWHLGHFWHDLQHVRFYSVEIVRWLVHRAGLVEVGSGANTAFPLGPDVPLRTDPLPDALPPPRAVGRERIAGAALPPSVRHRIEKLEERVNQLTEWASSLYPPAEYYVTGVAPPG
jgi:SAM-dependent methyltransferase